MSWTDLAQLGLNLYGNYQQQQAAKDAAAAQQAAAAQAADMAAFKPYSVTTGLGASYFNPETQTAGYTLDPALAAWRDQFMQQAAGAMPSSFDTTANANQYYNEMQTMMQPARQAENLQMQQDLFGSGRLGLRLSGEGAGAGTGMVQPDVFGLNQSRALADQALAQQARTQSQAELDASIARGTGLFNTAIGVEKLGLTPLELGGNLGGAAVSGNAAAADALLSGGLGAAASNYSAGLNRAGMFTGLANQLGSFKIN